MARARKEPEEEVVAAAELEAATPAEADAAEIEVEPTEAESGETGPAGDELPLEEPVAEEETAAEDVDRPSAPAPVKKRAPRPKAEKAKVDKAKVDEAKVAKKAKPKTPSTAKRTKAERKPIVRLPRPESVRGKVKERRGTVVSSAMDKTIVVRVDTTRPDRTYKKVVRRSRKFHAHDERNEANVGDVVRIVEARRLSRTKTWRLAEIMEAAE